MSTAFQTAIPNIEGNNNLREPQILAYCALKEFYKTAPPNTREASVILPVGCGKSGCIALTPFAFESKRTLVVAPGLNIAHQLLNEFELSNPSMFYQARKVLASNFPEPVELRGANTNICDLEDGEVVVTNIQQLQGENNKWLEKLSADFFDLIIFDEGHHAVAESWMLLKAKFPKAYIVNFSATPARADGKTMTGEVVYTYPIVEAIQQGFVKSLKAVVLNPKSLKYVREEDGKEVEVTLEEVIRLGEEESRFRKSIVTSKETLCTIVDASIRTLHERRKEAKEDRLKIIASALNYDHCVQVVSEYRARGLRADFIHSKADGRTNSKVLQKLENHELDVIVQVRKLGEGFDHPYLSVAAIFSIFQNLSPFVQFVGRVMRVIKQNDPYSIINQGVVIYHAGGNIIQRWSDFQEFSGADQEYFSKLLPTEGLDFSNADEIKVEPEHPNKNKHHTQRRVEVLEQGTIELKSIPLIDNPELHALLQKWDQTGITIEQLKAATAELQPLQVSKQKERRAKRTSLDDRAKIAAGKILNTLEINPQGKELDTAYLGKTNFVIVKSWIDKKIARTVGKKTGSRAEYSRSELDTLHNEFERIISAVEEEVRRATT